MYARKVSWLKELKRLAIPTYIFPSGCVGGLELYRKTLEGVVKLENSKHLVSKNKVVFFRNFWLYLYSNIIQCRNECEMSRILSNHQLIHKTTSRTVKWLESRQTTRRVMKWLVELWNECTHVKPRVESWSHYSNLKWLHSCQTTRLVMKRLVELWNVFAHVKPRVESWND